MSTPYTNRKEQLLGIDAAYEPVAQATAEKETDPFARHEDIDHFALIYDEDQEREQALVSYFRHGLERGERCFFVVEDDELERARDLFASNGIDVEAAEATGQLTFSTVSETYLKDGSFDPEEMVAFYEQVVRDAIDDYPVVRVGADTSWLRHSDTAIADFMSYEARVNQLFEKYDSVALCTYDRRAFEPRVIRDIIKTHPHLILENTVCHNVYYTPPAEFFEEDEADREVDRMVGTLVDRSEARVALEESEQSLQSMASIVCDPQSTLADKLHSLLDLGCNRFALDLGVIARVDPIRDHFTVEHVTGADEYFVQGDELPLSETYCSIAAQNKTTASVVAPEAEGYDDLRVYREGGFKAYLGTYISIEGDDDRVVCFLSTAPRHDPFEESEYSFLELLGEWVKYDLEQAVRERRLTTLNKLSNQLMHAAQPEEIADLLVESADELGLQTTIVALYDETSGRLLPQATTDSGQEILEREPLFDIAEGRAWRTFVKGEPAKVELSLSGRSDDTEVVISPLGDTGVLIAGGGQAPLSVNEFGFIGTVAGDVRSALERIDREAQLREREGILADQNTTLERLNRINDIIRSIDRVLVESTDRGEIEEIVCEELTASGPFEFAWIGKPDPVEGFVEPAIWAGAEQGFIGTLDSTAADYSPADRAASEREPIVINNVLQDRSYAPWRQEALNRGYHAMIALPLVYDDNLYGVLNVYASQPGVFDSLETAVLTELADNIAYAINAVESKKALVSEEVTELEFAVTDDALPALNLARAVNGRVTVENFVPRSEGGFRVFLTVESPSAPSSSDIESHLPLESFEIVANRSSDDAHEVLISGVITDGCFAISAIQHGGVPRTIEATPDGATIIVELAVDADVREFTSMFEAKLSESELVAQRSHERPARTVSQVYADVMKQLTARQIEVLQTAYFAGYFEQPRTSNSVEVAETIGITQPTFNAHIRSAQRTLCELLFDDRSLSDR